MDIFEGLQVKDLPGYAGMYKVSICGRVFKFYQARSRSLRGWHEVKPFTNSGNGGGYYAYYQIYLSKPDGSKGNPVAIHRLVAKAWLLPGRPDQIEINHKDNIHTNNHASNLEWVTSRENTHHYLYLVGGTIRGERNPTAILTEDKVLEIRAATGTHKEIASRYGVKAPAVWKIKHRRSWSHVPD